MTENEYSNHIKNLTQYLNIALIAADTVLNGQNTE